MAEVNPVDFDQKQGSVARALMAAARKNELTVVASDTWYDLVAELGDDDAAARHMERVATNIDRPVAVNIQTGEETSRTTIVPPRGWSDDRLTAWMATNDDLLAEVLGPTVPEGEPPA